MDKTNQKVSGRAHANYGAREPLEAQPMFRQLTKEQPLPILGSPLRGRGTGLIDLGDSGVMTTIVGGGSDCLRARAPSANRWARSLISFRSRVSA
jgi:hypothetical protein